MDTDDCTQEQKDDYISKKMFGGHWLYDYIVPIYNNPKLEKVLSECGITTQKVRDSEKGTFYEKVFPINNRPFSNDTLLEVTTLKEKLIISRNTNMTSFIDYCLSLLE